MENNEFKIVEYQGLKAEILARTKILHQIINLAVIIFFISLIILLLMLALGASSQIALILLLVIPPVFSLLTYNYQSNQITLEIAASYLKTKMPEVSAWEDYFRAEKAKHKMASFLKTWPLLIPQIVPIIIIGFNPSVLSQKQFLIVFIVDIVLFVLVLANFRYKLRKI